MPTYRARFSAILAVPTLGDRAARRAQEDDDTVIHLPLNPIKITLERNDHNHADTLHLTVPFKDSGFDVRLLQNAQVTFAIANSDDRGFWEPTTANVRFVGLLTRMSRVMPEDEQRVLEMEFLDYTTLYLEAKPFGAKGIPHYSMNLAEAWRTITSQVPGADVLADRIVFKGLDAPGPALGTAVAARFAKLTKVPAKPITDAWAVWQQCVGMLGLISFFDRDQVVVTTSTAYYTRSDPPRLILGENIKNMTETRNPFRRKGIGLSSFDPSTGRTIEALWPPAGSDEIKKKVIKPSKKRGVTASQVRQAEEREYFQYPSTTDPAVLLECAKRVYEERSRQEMEGTIYTAEMLVERASGATFDLLLLGSGDDVRIELAQEDKAMLASALSEGQSQKQMQDYLIGRGYDPSVAQLMAANVAQLAILDPVFYTKKVTIQIDVEGMEFSVEINYCNRLLIATGDAQSATA